ncbi:MAG: RnfH family protein [Burkholderiales bacterium]|nr:RnfH family protein [Burkholderiales bacterium]
MVEPSLIQVEVCYAGKQKTTLQKLTVPAKASLLFAIQNSGIVHVHPEIDISVCKVGIFGKLKQLDAELHEGDRIEIYRPLIADPMEARRRRAKKQINTAG